MENINGKLKGKIIEKYNTIYALLDNIYEQMKEAETMLMECQNYKINKNERMIE